MNNIPYITCGYPTLEATKKDILNHQNSPRIILSIPFSDPVTEDAKLQEACNIALGKNIKVKDIFKALSEVDIKVPTTIKTYANVIYNYGIEKFLCTLQSLNIKSIILPDIPFEEREEFLPYCQQYGIHLVPIVSTNSKERTKMLVEDATDFIFLTTDYCINEQPAIDLIKTYTNQEIISDQQIEYIL